MKVEPVEPVYKSNFNTKQNPNKNHSNDKKDRNSKKSKTYMDILEISAEGRKKLERESER